MALHSAFLEDLNLTVLSADLTMGIFKTLLRVPVLLDYALVVDCEAVEVTLCTLVLMEHHVGLLLKLSRHRYCVGLLLNLPA